MDRKVTVKNIPPPKGLGFGVHTGNPTGVEEMVHGKKQNES
jgi:hypothetical protein